MHIATTDTLATIVAGDEQQAVTATLECLEGTCRWVLRCAGEDAQTGAWDTLRECLQSAVDAWQAGNWGFELSEAGEAVLEG